MSIGIYLTEAKKEFVKSRLGKKVRERGFKTFNDYYEYVMKDETGRELISFFDSILTNFTFFSENRNTLNI